jgi:hypothetical protein
MEKAHERILQIHNNGEITLPGICRAAIAGRGFA